MNDIRVLDVTLRDGGCVNDFNFGRIYMDKILAAQEKAGIDIIELGYLDSKNGSAENRTKFDSEKRIYQKFLKKKADNATYVAMVDYGKFDVDLLENRNAYGIDGIRLAFHKKDYRAAVDLGKKIIGKGYQLYVQPMITLRYSDRELLDLIELVNQKLPDVEAFYIVDSFGEMRGNDLLRIWNIVDHNLSTGIQVGFHSHNNLQLSYANAIEFISIATERKRIVDASIMGMGKGAGNLNTELLLEHLNFYYGGNYKIAPLLEVIDTVINQIHAEFYWGYAPEYYLSASNHCSPTYARYFYSKHMLSIDKVAMLLTAIPEEKKISFDEGYAEKLYREFNSGKPVDDQESFLKIKSSLEGKVVVLIAPGKSIKKAHDKIKAYGSAENTVLIGLNTRIDFDCQYVITTREDVYEKLALENQKVIVASNISTKKQSNIYVIDYSRWTVSGDRSYDSSLVIAMKLLKECSVGKILLAGFDGFSGNMNENYFDAYMRHPIDEEQAQKFNKQASELIRKIKLEGIQVDFLTESKYQQERMIEYGH